MAKQPVAGSAKTRLTPHLTPSDAARLAECFVVDTIRRANRMPDTTVFVAVHPPEAGEYFSGLVGGTPQVHQHGATLGERLDSVLTTCLDRGHWPVLAIGSDVPSLPSWHIEEAFNLLGRDGVDAVLGPSEDGGYHLIGWTHPQPGMVRDVEMSTPRVLEETLGLADALSLSVALLPSWYDVDEPQDLDRLRLELESDPSLAPMTAGFLRTRRIPK